jgi:hypothetical protein
MQRAAVMEWFKHNPAKVFLLILILMGASVAAVFTYFGFFSPKKAPEASVEYFPLKVSIELDKALFLQGENVKVTLKLKNIADHAIKIALSNTMFYIDEEGEHHQLFFTFVVTDENEQVFDYVWNLGAIGSLNSHELNASEEVCNVLYWNQVRSPEETSVAPGAYYIRGLAPPNDSFSIGTTVIPRMETPNIRFKIIG